MALSIGFNVALLINFLAFATGLSKLGVYRQLHLTRGRAEAMKILRENDIDCGSISIQAEHPRDCWFWDPWRTYHVVFSADDESQVVMKSYVYRWGTIHPWRSATKP